jgi:FkbM family methyltransferase
MKLRLWRYVRQLLGYRPLTLDYGNGSWITIDERDWLQSSILSSGSYEPEVWAALARHAIADEVVWDVGAYIGSFALKASQDSRVKSVIAFEPDPLTFQILKRNLALNGDPATSYPLALSDTTERRTLIHGPATNRGMSTFDSSASTGIAEHVSDTRSEKLLTFDVVCRTADELIADGEVPAPTLMKIDAEGWEYEILTGAKQLVASPRLKAIAFEAASCATGSLADERLEFVLKHHGYSISRIRRPNGEIRRVENYLAEHE